MSDVITYPLSAAIELCEQLDNDETNYHLKMLEYKRERDEAREALEEYRSIAENIGAVKARTPETDDFELNLGDYSHPWKAIDLARKLERERDEARFLLKQAQSSLDAIHLEVGGWIKILKENTD